MDAHARKVCLVAQLAPQIANVGDRALGSRIPEYIVLLIPAWQSVKDCCSHFGQSDRSRAGLAVSEQQAPYPHLAPFEASDLRLAASGHPLLVRQRRSRIERFRTQNWG